MAKDVFPWFSEALLCLLNGTGCSRSIVYGISLTSTRFLKVFSMEVMGSKLAAGLTPQQIYLCHRTWGLLLEVSVQKAAEALLVSVILLRKINGHGDDGFEKFHWEIKVLVIFVKTVILVYVKSPFYL
jgi:hypothetical protein